MIYKIIAYSQVKAFTDGQFNLKSYSELDFSGVSKWDVAAFDDATRVKLFGYKSHVELSNAVSCKNWMAEIEKPFLLIYAKDDPVSQYDDIPKSIIQSNPNGLIIESEIGGHCDFFSVGEKGCRRFFPDLVLKYIRDVESYNNRKV